MNNTENGELVEELNQIIYESAKKDMEGKTEEGYKKAAAKFNLIPAWKDASSAEEECRKWLESIQKEQKRTERGKLIRTVSIVFLCIIFISGFVIYLGKNGEEEREINVEAFHVIITQSERSVVPNKDDPFRLSGTPRMYYCAYSINDEEIGLLKLTAKQFEECIAACIYIEDYDIYYCKDGISFIGKTEKMPDSMDFSLNSKEFYGVLSQDVDPDNVINVLEKMNVIEKEKDSYYKENYSGKEVLVVRDFFVA